MGLDKAEVMLGNRNDEIRVRSLSPNTGGGAAAFSNISSWAVSSDIVLFPHTSYGVNIFYMVATPENPL